jgi:Leucine Rich repeat
MMTQQIALVLQLLLTKFYCSCKDIVSLDIAVSSCPILRTGWLEQVIEFMRIVANHRWYQSHSTIRWLNKREIPILRLHVDCRRVDFVLRECRKEFHEIRCLEREAVDFLSKRNPSVSSVGVLLTKLVKSDPSLLLGAFSLRELPPKVEKYLNHLLSWLLVDEVSNLTFVGWKVFTLREVNLFGCQRISDIGLLDLIEGCPHLEHINLSYCMGFTIDLLSTLSLKCPYLLSINLSHSHMCAVTTLGLFAVVRSCLLLHTILLSNLEHIKDRVLSAIGSASSNLHTIDVSDCQGITDVGLSALAHHCKLLHTISLRNCKGITDTSLVALGFDTSQLHTIDVSDCQGITDVGLSALANHCKLLHTINFCNCQGITKDCLLALALVSSAF